MALATIFLQYRMVPGGLIYLGQLELRRGNLEEAISALTDATARKSFSSNAWRLLGVLDGGRTSELLFNQGEEAAQRGDLEGLEIDGRIVLVYSQEGLNDTSNAASGCCCCGGDELRYAHRINVNLLTYALTH